MAVSDKYQSLPDLDTWSPDVYETEDVEIKTPELDTSASSIQDNEDIDYTSISADQARERFLNKTLRTSTVEWTVTESVEMKIARLSKEIEELSATLETRDEKGDNPTKTVTELAETMKNAVTKVKKIGVLDVLGSDPLSASVVEIKSAPDKFKAETFTTDAAASKMLDLDARLANLERALGNTSSLASLTRTTYEQPILPTLASLTQAINTLTLSPDKFDQSLTKLQQLVAVADTLPKTAPARTGEQDDDAKVTTLYNSLGTIETLARVVPSLLDRLKSLHHLHSESSQVVESIDHIKQALDRAETDIAKWLNAVENAEKKVDELEQREKDNLESVKTWISELERQVANI
ncbi:Dynamitin-domain-containing protein [Lipomyces arxii]|uniref:Dynamitin-domain-containing protein n=1 Tax=Lipomyces arxii TaxID=56418 RepID=UPI0034CD6965